MNGRCAAFFISVALHGVAERANADEPEPTDTGRMRTGLVVAGAVTLGVGYAGSVFVARESGSPYAGWGYVPVVGAPILAERTEAHCDSRSGGFDDNVNDYCDGVPAIWLFSALSSIVQVAGGTMLAYGLLDRKSEEPQARFAVAPLVVGRAGYAIAASGSF